MSELKAESGYWLMVSRRAIVHAVQDLLHGPSTACGKGVRDLVTVAAVGAGERMCHACALRYPSGKTCCDQGMTCLECDPNATFAEYATQADPS